jgi:hypothetical protein
VTRYNDFVGVWIEAAVSLDVQWVAKKNTSDRAWDSRGIRRHANDRMWDVGRIAACTECHCYVGDMGGGLEYKWQWRELPYKTWWGRGHGTSEREHYHSVCEVRGWLVHFAVTCRGK